MPNAKKHRDSSAAAALLLNVFDQAKRNDGFCPFELLLAGATGYGTGRIPDILEPAETLGPRHRGLAHSVAAGVQIATMTHKARKLPNRYSRAIIRSTGASYLTHLAMDSRTPMGLPWVK